MAGVEVNCPGTIAIFLDKAPVGLGAGCRVHAGPTMFAVVPKAVNVSTEVGGKSPPTLHTMALIAHLVVQNIWLHFHLSAV